MLSDDDLDLGGMTDEELAAAWDLWFDLAQTTNEFDPPYTHGVFVRFEAPAPAEDGPGGQGPAPAGRPGS